MNVAVLFHRLGPYHHARLAALAARVTLSAVEFSKVDNTYAWAEVGGPCTFLVKSLLSDVDVETAPIGTVRPKVANALDDLHPEVIAIPGWSSPAALVALEWCSRTGTPAIVMSDSSFRDERRVWWKEWIKSRVVRRFSAAIVGGERHVDYVVALGLPHTKVFVGYDVVDNAYFADHAIRIRADAVVCKEAHGLPLSYFLASNRFVEKKNLSRLLQAYAQYVERARGSAWDLVLLGDGPLRRTLTDQVAELGLQGLVHMPGFKQYSDLPMYYALAQAFVHASTSEQWGLVVNEAMASGLPVLVSERCGCAPELVREGVNGFTFDPYDINEMADRMVQVSGGNCDLVAMGSASRDIIGCWSPNAFAEGMLMAAKAAIGGRRSKAGWFDRALLALLALR